MRSDVVNCIKPVLMLFTSRESSCSLNYEQSMVFGQTRMLAVPNHTHIAEPSTKKARNIRFRNYYRDDEAAVVRQHY